jgi:hypothetical protein
MIPRHEFGRVEDEGLPVMEGDEGREFALKLTPRRTCCERWLARRIRPAHRLMV